MDNCNKIKNICTDSTYATCIDYEGALSDNTTITADCVTVHNVLEDIYEIIDNIYGEISVNGLGESCLSYTGEITQKKVLERYEEEICELKTKVEELETIAICSVPITDCNLNFGAIVSACDEPIVTLAQALQAMLDQINANI